MVLLTHLLAIVAYGLGAVLVGLSVPRLWPSVGQPEAAALSALAFIVAALLHEVQSRRGAQARLTRALSAAHETLVETATSLDMTRHEIHQLRDELTAVESLARQRIDSEVAVVKTLLGQLYQHLESARGGEGPPLPLVLPARGLAAFATDGTAGENALIDSIRDALENNRIDLYLQPIVSLPQRKVRYYEAFSRLRDAQGNVLTPDLYLPVAEKTGLIATIDNLLLFRCTQLIRKLKRRKKTIGFFCNLSAHTMRDDRFFQQFADFLASQPDLADSLIFEISDAELAASGGAARAKLERLTAMGFRLSLDQIPDLNINFAGLARRNFRFVKIEASKLLSESTRRTAPIDVVDLKQALLRNGIDLIAAKIERERTVIELMDYEVDYGQGYLFGEPKPSRDDVGQPANQVA